MLICLLYKQRKLIEQVELDEEVWFFLVWFTEVMFILTNYVHIKLDLWRQRRHAV